MHMHGKILNQSMMQPCQVLHGFTWKLSFPILEHLSVGLINDLMGRATFSRHISFVIIFKI